MTSYLTPDAIARRLNNATRKGKGWQAQCPRHEDDLPSLSIDKGRKATLLYCHAGCSTAEVLAELGWRVAMLYHDYDPKGSVTSDAALRFRQVIDGLQPPTIDELMPCHTLEDVLYRAVWAPPHVWARVGVMWQQRLSEPFTQEMNDWWFRVTNGIIGDLLAERIDKGLPWGIRQQQQMRDKLWRIHDQCGKS